MAYKNINDRKAASKRHYESNRQLYLERNKKYRQTIKAYIKKIKEEKPCQDCGVLYPYYVMDFDHIDSKNKENDINFLSNTGRIGAVKREIQKCELVCANCHRIRTHKRYLDTLA